MSRNERYLVAYNRTRATTVASKVVKADDYASRSRGLLDRASMGLGEGLWIAGVVWFVPCPTIHTFGMRFAIDVVFLDKAQRVARVIENLKPWRLSPWVARARSVLELPAGTLKGTVKAGDQLEIA